MIPRLAAALLVLILLAPPAGARDIQVSSGQVIGDSLAVSVPGDRVLVETGSYFELLSLVDGVQLLGGYDGTFQDATRNPAANPTMIHGSDSGAPITGLGVGASTLVDGFILSGAGGSPGAAIVLNGASPVISNNEIRNNRRGGGSGGVYAFGGSAARVENNWFHDNSTGGSGGAMRIENSPVEVVGNTFEDCVAPNTGGAIYVFMSSVTISSNTFRDTSAGQGGGAICLQRVPSTSLIGNTFENCSAPFGGGVWLKDDSFATFENGTYTGCSGVRGGGLAVTNWSDVTSIDERYDTCSADIQGGGVYGYASFFSIMGQDASNPASTASFTDCHSGDGLNGKGGGIGMELSSGVVDKVRFSDCDADSMGGGVYFLHSDFTISEALVENCSSADGGGIAVHAREVDLLRESFVRNCTVHAGTATGVSNPAGGILLAAMGSNRVATLGGTVVSNTLGGVSIRCKKGGSAAQTGQPVITCTTIHNDPTNSSDTVAGSKCLSAVSSSGSNQDGVDPQYCDANPTTYTVEDCSPIVGSNCPSGTPGRVNRGVAPDATVCSCGVRPVHAAGWGEIKSMYR